MDIIELHDRTLPVVAQKLLPPKATIGIPPAMVGPHQACCSDKKERHDDRSQHRDASRAPLAKLQAYQRRMGWSFPWASSFNSDFNYDFQAAHTKEEWGAGAVEYNFGTIDLRPPVGDDGSGLDEFASSIVGTDWSTYRREGPGVSAFVLEDGVAYHTYSAYARGLHGLWGMYQWLDRAPLGRNETGHWWHRHDEYDSQ